jgi:ankyrin repeat protein
VNGCGSLGVTPLGLAAAWGHLSMAALLIQQGASVNATDADGDTPLMNAIWNHGFQWSSARKAKETHVKQEALQNAQRSLRIVQLLLSKGTLVDKVNRAGVTPLILAATFDDPSIIRTPIDHKANVHWVAKKGATAILVAVGCPSTLLRSLGEPMHLVVIRTLLKAGADVNAVRTSPLILAVRRGDVEAVKLLHRRGRNALDYAKAEHRSQIPLAKAQGLVPDWKRVPPTDTIGRLNFRPVL